MGARHHTTLNAFRAGGGNAFSGRPTAIVIIEDDVEIPATLDHLSDKGFAHIIACAPEDIPLPSHSADPVRVTMDTRRPEAMADAVNAALGVVPAGTWLHACYNGEFLIYPFCEDRSIGEMLAFHAEEKRDAMVTFVVDLYASDLDTTPSGVDREAPFFDTLGYYALSRNDPDNHNHPRERQLDFFGGLRWRFEEHVDGRSRRIDRIGLFRATKGLQMRADNTFNIDEYNTYACQWHNNLTATICSFRAAKALMRNPLSRDEIETFLWQGSQPFDWTSQSLLDLGLMEPGQWF